jgi:hypothetical protein
MQPPAQRPNVLDNFKITEVTKRAVASMLYEMLEPVADQVEQ